MLSNQEGLNPQKATILEMLSEPSRNVSTIFTSFICQECERGTPFSSFLWSIDEFAAVEAGPIKVKMYLLQVFLLFGQASQNNFIDPIPEEHYRQILLYSQQIASRAALLGPDVINGCINEIETVFSSSYPQTVTLLKRDLGIDVEETAFQMNENPVTRLHYSEQFIEKPKSSLLESLVKPTTRSSLFGKGADPIDHLVKVRIKKPKEPKKEHHHHHHPK